MNNEPPNTTKTSLKQGVMEAIQKGRIRMRPRWHFVLFSSLATLGVLIMFLAVLYIASLSIFFLHDSGAWFAPRFGGRGWWSLLQSLPWLLITLLIVFICVLQIAVRRYEFVYRRPLLISAAAILAIVFIGGFAIAETPLHRQMEFYAHHNELPPPLSLAYGAPLHMPAPPGIFHGTVLASVPGGFIMNDQNGAGTTTILIGLKTKLPDGGDFEIGDDVVVIGDPVATSTVRAFGVVDVGE